MNKDAINISNGLLRTIGFILGFGLILFFLYKIQTVIVYFFIASVVSLMARPVIRFLKFKLKVPNNLAVIITIIIYTSVLLGIVSLFIPLIAQQGKNLSLLNFEKLEENYHHLIVEINRFFGGSIDQIENFKNIDISSSINQIPNFLNVVLSTIGSFSIGLFSVLFISFFLMKDKELLHDIIYLFPPEKHLDRFQRSFSKIKDLLSRYFVGLVMQISILFTIYSITLLIFDVDNAFVIAFLCALLNLIPYLGPIIGCILMLFLTMSEGVGQDFNNVVLPKTAYILMGYLFAQLVDNFFSQPFIFSKSVKSHPLEIFLVILIAGTLFGAVGMILAVPVYTAIKVIMKEFFAENKFVKFLTHDFD